jgi:hypothetical protein
MTQEPTVHDDQELSRHLTALIRATPGVDEVYPAQPVIEAAADAIAVKLALRQPDVLVDIDRDHGSTTITAGIAADVSRPAPDTVREVGERIRDALAQRHANGAEAREPDLITVTIRLVEGLGAA